MTPLQQKEEIKRLFKKHLILKEEPNLKDPPSGATVKHLSSYVVYPALAKKRIIDRASISLRGVLASTWAASKPHWPPSFRDHVGVNSWFAAVEQVPDLSALGAAAELD